MGCGPAGRLGRPVERDLAQIKTSDTLRVITRNHPLTYYLYRGTRRGFDYELISKFAEEQGLVLEIVMPPEWSDMIPALYHGEGDVIAAMMTVTPDRRDQLSFTRRYLEVRQVTVGTSDSPPPQTIEELDGRRVLVRRGSSYEERLRELRRRGIRVEIEYHNELEERDDPVVLVAKGEAPLTVVDNTVARLEQQFYPGLEIGVAITDPQPIAWAVRPNSPELLAALNDFLGRYYRSAYFNILRKRYFENTARFLRHRTAHLALYREGKLSRYDEEFRAAAAVTDFDWRLLAAQAYHESRFLPDKTSWAGAVGLMQLMPRTAEMLGVKNLYDPAQNILGGARYLRKLYGMYGDVDGDDRLRLALAAYNCGIGHVADARKLARERGGDPRRWEDVAGALRLLEQPEYYRKAEYGYVRGGQVLRYVEDVFNRYDIFRGIVPETPPEPAPELALGGR